jgi:protein-disulfide isomerase
MRSFPVIALALAALVTLSGCQQTQDAGFGERVRGYLLAHPEVLEEALQKLQEKKVADAANVTKAALKTNRQALEADPRDLVANPTGSITVVEFFDYRCGYCKTSAPEILRLIRENPDVRFVFKELPIFGGASNLAAGVALTAAGKAKGLELYQAFMSDKALDEAAIARHLSALGINPQAAKAEIETVEVQSQLADTKALATKLGIEGTPAFIVGDHFIPGADMAALRAAISVSKGDTLKRPG